MTDNLKELKIQFAPGCFDNFEGTQEELDELINEITQMFKGKTHEEIEAMSTHIDFEDPDDEDLELIEHLHNVEKNSKGRTLQ